MIFTVRQPVEKSWEHRASLLVTFIDLKKAYDSVPRNAVWMVLALRRHQSVMARLPELRSFPTLGPPYQHLAEWMQMYCGG